MFDFLPFSLSGLGTFAIVAIAVFGVITAIMLRRVVPTNMVHIVQTSKHTIAYGRGKDAGNTYYEWPAWVPVIGITVIEFPESIFQVNLKGYEAYDQARLPFVVDAVAFFRVEEAEKVAQRVATFQELTTQLEAVLQGSVRRIMATNTLENIMEQRAELGQQFTNEVKDQLKEWGVLPVKTIEFMDLSDTKDSHVIANIMAKEKSRIDKESRIKVAENNREAELAEIDAKRVVEVQRQDAEQQVGQRTAEKEKAVGIANEKAQQEIKVEAKVTAEKDMDVKKVNDVRSAEIAKDVAIVDAEKNKQVTIVSAEGEKQAVIVKAEGDLQAAEREAQAIRATGEAEGAAETARLMAPVETQIKLAKEIGSNEGYQSYLVSLKQIEAGQAVGIEMAKAMQEADLKVIANSGDMQGGIAKLGDMFTPAGGTSLTGMLAALSQTDEGKALVGRLTGSASGGNTSARASVEENAAT